MRIFAHAYGDQNLNRNVQYDDVMFNGNMFVSDWALLHGVDKQLHMNKNVILESLHELFRRAHLFGIIDFKITVPNTVRQLV